MIRELTNQDTNGSFIVEWDGKNNDDTILPVGVYIILFECTNQTTGKKTLKKEAIVLGKTL
jgi:hypothetical protein